MEQKQGKNLKQEMHRHMDSITCGIQNYTSYIVALINRHKTTLCAKNWIIAAVSQHMSILLLVTLPNVDQFSHFFHTHQEIAENL